MLPDASDFLDCLASFVGSQAQHLVDQTLTHQGEAARAETTAPEQVLDVTQPSRPAIDPNLRLPVAMHPANDLKLSRLQVEPLIAVVELESNFGESARRSVAPA